MQFQKVIQNRRAVNFFDTEKDVPENLLKHIVETASLTPSSFNLQPWNLIEVRDQAEKSKLRELAWDQPKVSEAPVILVILADRSAWQEEHPVFEKNFHELTQAGYMKQEQRQWLIGACDNLYGKNDESKQAFACKNAGFFAMSIMLAAKDVGLDTHPMDGFDHEAVKQYLNIPEEYWIPLLLAVGYFREDKELLPPKWRKSYEEIKVSFK